MKKVFTILISVAFIVSGLYLSIDRHYCNGNLAAVKVSLTGDKASCGMARTFTKTGNLPAFGSKCCEDKILFLSAIDNFFPEFLQISGPFAVKQVIFFDRLLSEYHLSNATFSGYDFPPGKFIIYRLSQPDICVFRI